MKIQQFCGEGQPRGGRQEQRGNGRPYRKGEEASTKLLIPMFLMLGVVMVMVVAPAFLSL